MQIDSPNVEGKMANEAASIGAAKETSKGTKKWEGPSDAEPYEGFHKRQQHLETRKRQIRLLFEEKHGQPMEEPPAKKLKSSHPMPPREPPNTDTARTPSSEAAAESQKPTAPFTPAPKRKASGPASAKAAKKPRGPDQPKKEATAPEPASLLSPPHTSGSEPSVSPEQKQREPETQQQQATSASSASPTEPTKATALVNAPITASSLKKIPPKPTGAIKAVTGARKTTKAPRVTNTTTIPRATPPPLPTTLPPHHYLATPFSDRQYGSLSYLIRMSPADYSLLKAPLGDFKRPLLESSLKEATPMTGAESYRDLNIGYCFPLRGPKGEMPRVRLREIEDEDEEGYYWVEVRGLGVIEKEKVFVPERWDDPWALAFLKEEGSFEDSDSDSDSDSDC